MAMAIGIKTYINPKNTINGKVIPLLGEYDTMRRLRGEIAYINGEWREYRTNVKKCELLNRQSLTG